MLLALPFTGIGEPGGCEECKKCGKEGAGGGGGGCMISKAIPDDAKPPGKISDEQRDELILLQEEERLAFDVYNKLGEKYPLNPFKNIPRSEANHMEATAQLLAYHGLPAPAKLEAGKYASPKLQKLYNKFIKRGQKSEIDALKVGALVEETDIRDLRRMAENPPSEVAKDLSKQLELASYNHLRAFVRNLSARGVDYRPVILEQKDFDQIVGNAKAVDKPRSEGQAKGGGNQKRQRKRAERGRGRQQ